MKTRHFLFIVLALGFTVFARAEDWPAERQARASAMAKKRYEFAASEKYNPYDLQGREVAKSCRKLMEDKKYSEVIAATGKALDAQPFNVDLLILQAAALRAEGETAKADEVRTKWMEIIDSIATSGDGKTTATAYRVISVEEEYAYIRAQGYRTNSQRLIGDHGSEYDVLNVSPRSEPDKTADIYFNIDLPKHWLNRQFGGATKR